MIEVDNYRVGIAACFRNGRWANERRYLARQIKVRNWRAVRLSLKGFRSEHDGCSHDVGTAWFSERAAIRRANRLCAEAQR
jgi:hypothetical protein